MAMPPHRTNLGATRRLAVVVALFAPAITPAALAHDLWIEPHSFRPDVGDTIRLRLIVGHGDQSEVLHRDDRRIERFVLWDGAAEQPIAGVDGSAVAGVARVRGAGRIVVGYRSNHAHSEMDAAAFEQYLKHEGLEHIVEQRRTRGESGKAGTEVYSRSAKALLDVGGAPGSTSAAPRAVTRPFGFKFEIVPEADPYALKPGDELSVRLLFDNAPAANVLVEAQNRRLRDAPQALRTDAEGRATFKLPTHGEWMITAVYMSPAPASAPADWESFWGSLTFELPADHVVNTDAQRPRGESRR